MQKSIQLRLLPSEAENQSAIIETAAAATGHNIQDITGFNVLKRSIDARGKQAFINLTLNFFIKEPFIQRAAKLIQFGEVSNTRERVIIIGAGPAGLFAALKLIEHGVQPVILERGKDVRARRRDLAALNKEGIVN